jgi:L-lactate dehydrogenase complex protein LldG
MSTDPQPPLTAAETPGGTGPLDAFLHALRRRTEAAPHPTPLPDRSNAALRAVRPAEELAARFAAEATAAGCVVHRVTEANWLAAAKDIVGSLSARLVLVQPQPGTALTAERAAALADALATAGRSAVSKWDDDTLFNCDAAVTGVVAAIAETGTLVCVSGPAAARGASLIPPVHIALLDRTQIVGDLFDYFDRLANTGSPANINLITGPSKTADIEGILITGVHGPGVVHVLLLE